MGTGAEANISIANRSQASGEEVARTIAEAEAHRSEDRQRLKKVENTNELEATIYEASKDCEDGKIADILQSAADKEAAWLEDNKETASAGDIAMHRRGLARRLEGKSTRGR